MKTILTLLSASFALSSIGSAALLYQYQANSITPNPTAQGWTAPPANAGITVGGINDSGTPAWFVNDQSTTFGASYNVTPTAGDITATNTLDWKLSITLRDVNPSDAPNGALVYLFRNGVKSYQMHFGTTALNEPIVVLADGVGPGTGATYTLTGGSGYNTYDLTYSQSAGSAALSVNGSPVLSGYTGITTTQFLLAWGSGASTDTGQGNYASVSLSTVPEPTTALLGSLGVLVFAFRRIRFVKIA